MQFLCSKTHSYRFNYLFFFFLLVGRMNNIGLGFGLNFRKEQKCIILNNLIKYCIIF